SCSRSEGETNVTQNHLIFTVTVSSTNQRHLHYTLRIVGNVVRLLDILLLPSLCRRSAAALPPLCRRSAVALPSLCRRSAVALPSLCRRSAAHRDFNLSLEFGSVNTRIRSTSSH
ncbi:unnamed protein product, partial [Pleuronectes platessa]